MNYIQKICLLVISATLIFGLCGCDELVSILSEGEAPPPIPDELLIGVVMPLSGAFVDGPDDPDLHRYLNGFYMARDEITAHSLRRRVFASSWRTIRARRRG